MEKFKVGDKIRSLESVGTDIVNGGVYTVTSSADGYVGFRDDGGDIRYRNEDNYELLIEGESKVKERRTFKQLKDTVDTRKGALWQEACDDGTQEYILLTTDLHKGGGRACNTNYPDRELVENQPEWFVEVFKVTPEYMTREELDKYKEFVKGTVKTVKNTLADKPKISKRQITIAKYAIKHGDEAAADKYKLTIGSIMTYRSLY